MTFENINVDIDCDCLEGAICDTESHFGRKTNKNFLKPGDFISYWEKGKRSEDQICAEICSLKGISLNFMNDESKENVINIFKQLFPISPSYKPHIHVIQLGGTCGYVKHTPDHVNGNLYHYDFYKSDEFNLEDVTHVEVISLAEYV